MSNKKDDTGLRVPEIELQKLEASDFDIFKSWIKSEAELLQFAGPIFEFPVTDEQLNKYINDQRRIAYKVVLPETNKIIGNAELNFENPLPRLSRILIAKAEDRNKGIGRQIIDKMLEKLFLEFNFKEADLNVFDWNRAAIRCYQKAGFDINPDMESKYDRNGEIWTAINMKITKHNWQKLRT